MATLTKSTGTVTLSGAVEKVTLPAAYGWVWIKNMSDGDMFLGLSEGISAGADGVLSIPSGDAGRIQTDGQDSVYLMGSGNALVVAQNYADCPFKTGAKGGGADVGGESSYTLTNAVDYPLVGLTMYGKSTQDGTPTPDNPVEIVSVGDGGSVAVQACGKNLFPWNDYTEVPIMAWGHSALNATNNEINYSAKENSLSNSGIRISHDAFGKYFTSLLSGITFNISCEMRADIDATVLLGMQMSALSTCKVNGVWQKYTCTTSYNDNSSCQLVWSMRDLSQTSTLYVRNIQIEIGNTATAYEPYKGTTANITSALPLCGIPVADGGNYTDSNGQQWICDEVVYNADGSGKIIKHTAKIGSYNGETITTPYISTTGSLTTGATVVYHLADPLEIPLTAAEMSALRALQSFNGITNISNDGGADMDVSYCTNKMLSKYVMPITTGLQAQIDDLKAAVLSLGGNV